MQPKQIEKAKLRVHHLSDVDIKRATAGPSINVDLDIPESVGVLGPSQMSSSSRLMDLDLGKLGRRKA